MKKKIKESFSRKVFIVINAILLTALALIMLLPFLKVIAESLSSKQFVESGQVWFWPRGLTFSSYKMVFKDSGIFRAFLNSVFITVVGTAINLFMTMTLAYATSRKEFKFSKPILLMITFSMIFSAPLIPSYLLVKNLGMDNTFWAVLLPGAIVAYYFFVMRSFFMGLPEEMLEAARVDGCGEWRILWKIVCPVSKPSIMTVGLFYGVSHWNALYQPLIYLRAPSLQTLQMKLYSLLMMDNMNVPEISQTLFSSQTIKMTTIVVATLPILMIYPLLQKHFVQGATIGAVKG